MLIGFESFIEDLRLFESSLFVRAGHCGLFVHRPHPVDQRWRPL